MLVNGRWQAAWDPYQKADDKGNFTRETASFRHWITPDGSAGPTGNKGFKAEAGRYHLYVAYICPWASRVLALLKLKQLEHVISISVVEPFLTDFGWSFAGVESRHVSGATEDHLHQKPYLYQLYLLAEPMMTGRATVPVLWDKKQNTIVNNESADILAMLDHAFESWAKKRTNLRPIEQLDQLNQLNEYLYTKLNNGVYRAGFAQSQQAYEAAVEDVFDALEALENRLSDGRRFLLGLHLTEADIRLFVTLIRFDCVYFDLFKCNIKPIRDYNWLSQYLFRLFYDLKLGETVHFDHIKQGYYSVKALNPNGVVPNGPNADITISNQEKYHDH
ncbi:glutathione S-transferase C-terminal domain-containing protein [Motilimonas cestriensis]|uniref:Glutathione S-transferase C-terminal domain-containing protein n=1 Tax=Motilimonas cestriensis TaxID=2742685 RepID=A0ABS8W717_9GAMM|nr:glutathione S-transferase C-terminal domain-containing protein [Motilimonas cestriensis]MCE2594802.1 glutathione S-transferase C-terminal domain-containing protein [Motilimonas cestriensis]